MKHILYTVTLAICWSTLADAQTIADVARKERARRQANAATSITNESLKVDPPVPFKESVQNEAKEAEEKNPASAAPAPPVPVAGGESARDEKWWRSAFEKARADLTRAENQVVVLDSDLKKANLEYLTRSFDAEGRGKKALDESYNRAVAAQKEVAGARERLAQLEEELRRSGAPAGWAR